MVHFRSEPVGQLTLRELEALAGAGLTGLFAFLHARVAGEAPGLLEDVVKRRVGEKEGAGEGVADGAGLSRRAAALGGGDDVVLLGGVREDERLDHEVAGRLAREERGEFAVVDEPFAGAWKEADAGDGGFPTAGCSCDFVGHCC